MPLRAGFDLDGVLADLDRAILEIAVRLFGPDQVEVPDGRSRARLTGGQAHLAWTAAVETPDFWETLPETESGIVARIDREARARGWDLVFVTQRPPTAGDPVEDQTRRWLANHGCPEATVIARSDSRGLIVEELGLTVAVDDRPENCASIVAESDAHAILVWRDEWGPLETWRRAPGVEVVQTTAAALERLIAETPEEPADREPAGPSSRTP